MQIVRQSASSNEVVDDMSWLQGRVILITGGGSGLGREVALQSAALGAKVVIMDTHTARLEATRADVARIAGDCLALQTNVNDESEVAEAVAAVMAKWGQLDTVVNSAGVYYFGPITTTPMADFDRVYNVNVRGLYIVCREAARAMLRAKSGHLINVASIAAERGIVGESVYSSSKWAVRGLGQCLTAELGPEGIRVTTVFPGGMDTTFWETDPRLLSGEWNPSRMLRGEDVATAIVNIANLPAGVSVKEAQVYRPGV
ncbi:MAG: SDR family oxidoreductase [Chloroflexi bacterium]|nr:SDR family oxidoreductase [Chloroflexota bacterium]